MNLSNYSPSANSSSFCCFSFDQPSISNPDRFLSTENDDCFEANDACKPIINLPANALIPDRNGTISTEAPFNSPGLCLNFSNEGSPFSSKQSPIFEAINKGIPDQVNTSKQNNNVSSSNKFNNNASKIMN